MTYAQHRKIIDVDSHLIELDDFLRNAARAADLELLHDMDLQQTLKVNQDALQRGKELFEQRQNDPEMMAKFEDNILDNKKPSKAILFLLNVYCSTDSGESARLLNESSILLPVRLWVLPSTKFSGFVFLRY